MCKNCQLWTKEEEEYLRKHYNKLSGVVIAKNLNKTYQAVKKKGIRLGLKKNPRWAQEELDYLEKYSLHSLAKLSKALGRSVESVRKRLYLMDLSNPLVNEGYITLSLIFSTIYGKTRSRLILSCIKKGLKYRIYRCPSGRTIKYTDIDSFWNWAEKNQSMLNFSKFEPLMLGVEPKWVAIKRKSDFAKSLKKNEETKPVNFYKVYSDEDKDFIFTNYNVLSYHEIARKLGRTPTSILSFLNKHKLNSISEIAKGVSWKEDEQETLIFLYKNNISLKIISEILDRSYKSVVSKYYDLRKKGLIV